MNLFQNIKEDMNICLNENYEKSKQLNEIKKMSHNIEIEFSKAIDSLKKN